jgi:subtilisin family serine protease
MAQGGEFPHLPLPFLVQGRAKLGGGGNESDRTKEHKKYRDQHIQAITENLDTMSGFWKERRERRSANAPPIPADVPILLEIEPSLEVDWLITSLGLEVVSEVDDGYVLVASSDLDFAQVRETLEKFRSKAYGSATVARLYKLEDDDSRLQRVLSPKLWVSWPRIKDDETMIVDVSVECVGTARIPEVPERKEHDTDESYQKKYQTWEEKKFAAEAAWDDLYEERERSLLQFILGYGGTAHYIRENAARSVVRLPDCLEARLEISGLGFKDLVLNFAYLFEVSEPPDIARDNVDSAQASPGLEADLSFGAPAPDAPIVAIIDSGLQEGHRYLRDAVRAESSMSLVPEEPDTKADHVRPDGHGTRVAGAALFRETVPTDGHHQHPFWVQNIRVLDAECRLSPRLHPPSYLAHIVRERGPVKIFNHSINTAHPCRLQRMSAWGATMDYLSYREDILFVQSAGNIDSENSWSGSLGILNHLAAGRLYPGYLLEPSCRIASPAESLHALVVGSIVYAPESVHALAQGDRPSVFSRSGYGLWGTIRPDVVEYGGDLIPDGSEPPRLTVHSASACNLPRATLSRPGPSIARDAIGTSFAAPKVAALAAELQRRLPEQPCLLYRALIANSARWPSWAEAAPTQDALRSLGYGVPDWERALTNSPHRVTLVTSGVSELEARQAHIFCLRIPKEICSAHLNQKIRIDVTLSFVGLPRRTRRDIRRYLSTRLTWDVSKANESLDSFQTRVLKDLEASDNGGSIFPWTLRERKDLGVIEGTNRHLSTLQKDWAVVPAHSLPEEFCLAVIGRPGWSKDPADKAKYALAISFEAVDGDLEIYQPIKLQLENMLTQIQLQLGASPPR